MPLPSTITSFRSGFIILMALITAVSVDAYSTGPPTAACLSQQPFHSKTKKPGASDFYPGAGGAAQFGIAVGANSWNSSGTLTLTLAGTSGGKGFAGFIIKAVRASNSYTNNNLGPLLGSFVCTTSAGVSAPPKYYSVYAASGENNCVAHSIGDDNMYSSVSCTWAAPASNEGPIMFVATVVSDYDNYQTQIQSAVIPNSAGAASFTTGNETLQSSPTLFGCGTTKTCALYPPSCDTRGGCRYGVLITPMPSTNQLLFEVFGNTFDWLAVGLGDSDEMENLEVFQCGYDTKNSKMRLEFGYAPGKCVMPAYRSDITNVKTRIEMGNGDQASLPVQPNKISCQFVRPVDASFNFYMFNMTSKVDKVVTINSKMSGSGKFLVLAQGLNLANTPNLGKHTHIPLRTPARLTPMGTKSTVYFKGIEATVQTHGTLMTIFWLFLCGVALIVARHTRPVLTQKLIKKQLWFLIHVGSMLIGYIIALAGLIYILVKEGEWETDSQTHGIFGIIGMSLGLINIIAGIFRPHPGAKHRSIFNRLHRWNGLLAMAFATVAIWLGATFESLRPEFRFWAVIVLAIYTGMQIFFMILFECLRLRVVRNKRLENTISRRFELTDKSTESVAASSAEQEPEPKIKGKQLVHVSEGWLAAYGCVFLALAAAFWAGLWMH